MKNILIISLLSVTLSNCGVSIYSSLESPDAATRAAIALENKDPSGAKAILDVALAKGEDPILRSLRATAWAEVAEVSVVNLAVKMAENQDQSSTDVTALFPVLPAASKLSILQKAIDDMGLIGTLKDADQFKLTMYNTAAFALSLKQYDFSGDNDLSAAEINSITDFTTINSYITNATSAASSYGGGGDSSTSAITNLNAIKTGMGGSLADLKSFLGS